jgi:DNA-binding CsgD family transcriptional regulator
MILWKSKDGSSALEKVGKQVFLVRRTPVDDVMQAMLANGAGVHLTKREEEVLAGVKESLGNKEIAARLNIAERTVKYHVSSLLVKFGCMSRHELVFR